MVRNWEKNTKDVWGVHASVYNSVLLSATRNDPTGSELILLKQGYSILLFLWKCWKCPRSPLLTAQFHFLALQGIFITHLLYSDATFRQVGW